MVTRAEVQKVLNELGVTNRFILRRVTPSRVPQVVIKDWAPEPLRRCLAGANEIKARLWRLGCTVDFKR